ncbi:uncharacterized protein BYT42DRAFT_595839 [Radiomyces spectabilis]|uniref:uncharacterized protein n=1 Tax=Radiomyces spectabilis TaxID=64574 RepID=UPI00221EEE95|nr:uncharacterized protein BYT42DRAFT_595839 [Radiomyces spectabilis]KAI8366724.1 hypothetical protein BYT42DRAFT_595839 [Radiomyces spectabilis]
MADAPGEPVTLKSKILGTVASASQSYAPLKSICQTVCGFHIYAHDMTRQVHAHHFCSHVNEDFRQCVIYDSPNSDARLIGIEYIISEKLFAKLDDEEKKFWHSHDYEVRGGTLAMPMLSGMPEVAISAAERQPMLDLQKTYGKTWHTWQVDRGDTLPLGPPQLMMALTADGQLDPEMEQKRQREEGISTQTKKDERKDFPEYTPLEGADHWKSGKSVQLKTETVQFKSK